ncbi:hypothetical protein GCM10023317_60730 [Actinopolymorpha pittospori]
MEDGLTLAMYFRTMPVGTQAWAEVRNGEIATGGLMSSPESSLPPDQELLTSRQAFLAMSDFIWQFAQRAGDDLLTLIGDTTLEADGGPTDPAAWDDWLASVAKIKAGKTPRSER